MKSFLKWSRKSSAVFAAVCLCLLSSSCFYREISRNQENLAKIRKGMTRKQVLNIMGPPVTGEVFCTEKTLFYYTNQVWMDGLITRDECTPIRFDDYDRVEGWGKEYNTGIHNPTRITIRTKNKR